MNFDEIINKPSELIVSNYFELQREAEKKYGNNTVVLIEIGSFFEIYQSETTGKAKEIAKTLNILLTKKNKSIPEVTERNPNLCGIPTVSLDKHLEKLISEDKWTILMVKQKGTPPNITRYVERIISPGTNTDYINQDEYSFISSLFIEKNKKDIFYIGLSLIDLSLAKTLVFENFGTSDDKKIPLDEVEQIIRTHNIKETVISFDGVEESEQRQIIHALNLKEVPYSIRTQKEIKSSVDISYQNELFEKIFKAKGFYSAIEDLNLERMPMASASLSILLDFIIEHNKTIVNNLSKPEIISSNKFMYLGNNPMEQLNIHSENLSVLKIVNNGITAIGKRYIAEQLLNPLYDRREIEKRLTISALFISFEKNLDIELLLKEIYDIERIWRKIDLQTISPFELFNFTQSMTAVKQINEIIEKELSQISFSKKTISSISLMIKEINEIFDMNFLQKFNLQNINSNFIKKGVNSDLDKLTKELSELEKIVISTAINLEKIIDSSFNENYFSISEYKGSNVSISYNETEGFCFEITEKRQENKKEEIEAFFKNNSLKMKKLKTSTKFYSKEIFDVSEKIISTQSKIISLCKKIFISFSEDLKNKESFLNAYEETISFISSIDFYLNNVKLFEKKNYCIPSIIEDDNNFYEAEELRHPIVESIEENGIFIPNNITLGSKALAKLDTSVLYNKNNDYLSGFLLYGINSSGKTILSKSIGISVILAQAGFFVPAKNMTFTLFDGIFTRISGNDNIQKGLSTFAIEMLELKNIFNRATKKSLVLGDEISHGTETNSGLSIVASTILSLEEIGAFFILATHLHQLDDIPLINELTTITNVHLSIIYDEDKDKLIYNRKLQSGSGSSVYGLEFAKSLKLPEKFIKRAYEIRSSFSNDLSETENLAKKKKSKYNTSVFVGSCSLCSRKAEDVHHINEQHKADENGMIDHFHKNHKHNLLPLCKSCHDKVHNGEIIISGFMKTSNGLELIFEEKKEK